MAKHVDLKPVLPISITGGHPLFVSSEGILYSFHHGAYHQLRPQHTSGPKSKKNGRRKQIYYKMSDRYGNILVHHAVALAFIGPQPVERLPPSPKFPAGRLHPYDCHHLNGITTDNRPENLIWLSQSAHRRFDAALAKGLILSRDPGASSQRNGRSGFRLEGYDRMEYDMSHHMEC